MSSYRVQYGNETIYKFIRLYSKWDFYWLDEVAYASIIEIKYKYRCTERYSVTKFYPLTIQLDILDYNFLTLITSLMYDIK